MHEKDLCIQHTDTQKTIKNNHLNLNYEYHLVFGSDIRMDSVGILFYIGIIFNVFLLHGLVSKI